MNKITRDLTYIAEELIDLIVCFDNNFKITFINKAYRNFFNLHNKDVLDLDFFSLIVPQERQNVKYL